MTEIFELTGRFDRRIALSSEGLLREFNDAGVLTAADVHVARRLGVLGGEGDERVLLAVALATRAVRLGSVCVDLAGVRDIAPEAETPENDLPWPDPAGWAEAVAASPLVEAGVLRWEFDLLYLDRYRQQEVQVAQDLRDRAAEPPPPVDDAVLEAGVLQVFPDDGYAEQRAASLRAARQWTTVLTGGPGTGKTTAVAGLLALLAEQAEHAGARPLRIALTAPTGKAAARLQGAVADASTRLPQAYRDRLGELPAATLHRLLGVRPDNATRFRHDRSNHLPHDVIVVDETSMVSLTMMARLLEAVRPDTRLVLVGDPDQLASVEAGAVLSDLVAGLGAAPRATNPPAGQDRSPVAALRTAHRYGQEIGALADALRGGDADAVLAALRSGGDAVQFLEVSDAAEATEALRPHLLRPALELRDLARRGDLQGALKLLDRHRLLCAHRAGPFGVRTWNRRVEQWITEETGDPLWEPMYPGRPLLVTANDYGLGLYNGDTGVVVRPSGSPRSGPTDGAALPGGTVAVLAGATGTVELATSRIADVDTMHAMTIHKSQGSQADVVTVLLPDADSRLLTRELFYTAVTRAQSTVRVVGSEDVVRAAVERRVQRASGLRHRLAGPPAAER